MGDTNLQDAILETSDFGAADSEIDVATDEGFIEYTSINNIDESQTNNTNNDDEAIKIAKVKQWLITQQ